MPRRLIRRFATRMQPAVDRPMASPVLRRYVRALCDPDLWPLDRRPAARADGAA